MATPQPAPGPAVVRVGFALGSWQLVALAAGLAEADARAGSARRCEDHLVLYETVPVSPALIEAMCTVGQAVRPWRSIVDAFDFFARVRRKIAQAEFDALKEALRQRLGLLRVDELWLCWITRPPEKLIMETFAEAAIHLYEDGLMSYLPIRRVPAEPPPQRLSPLAAWRVRLRDRLDARWPVRRFRRYKSAVDPRHASRLAGRWLLLGNLWPPPAALAQVRQHDIALAVLRGTLARCTAATASALPSGAAEVRPGAGRPVVLMLGQTLSRWQVLGRDDELKIYRDAVSLVLGRGYDVCWKEHPRALHPFFAELAAAAPAGRVRELALPFALPVELVAGTLGLSACVAGISAALFYLPRLYGMAAFSFADALAPHLSEGWALQNELVRRASNPLSALPPAAEPPVPAA